MKLTEMSAEELASFKAEVQKNMTISRLRDFR